LSNRIERERLPYKWAQVMEKQSLKFMDLEQVLIKKDD